LREQTRIRRHAYWQRAATAARRPLRTGQNGGYVTARGKTTRGGERYKPCLFHQRLKPQSRAALSALVARSGLSINHHRVAAGEKRRMRRQQRRQAMSIRIGVVTP